MLELFEEEKQRTPGKDFLSIPFLNVAQGLGDVYQEQKRYKQAKQLYLKVIEMYKDSVGEDSPYIKRILFKMEVIETYIDT